MPQEQDNVLARIPNPFASDVYTNAWQDVPTDVASINEHTFDALWAAFEAVRGTEGNMSVLVQGSPGAGKTHLLGRLRQRLASTAEDAPDGAVSAVFTHVQLSANPEHLWRHLRRRLTDNLMHEVGEMTQLQRIVAHELAHFIDTPPAKMVRALSVFVKKNQDLVERAMEQMFARLDVPAEAGIAIEHLVQRRKVRHARAWLRGDYLSPEHRAALGVNPEPDPEDAEDEARSVVIALARISPRTLPMVFCFDQIEALERHPGDEEAIFKFGKVAGNLFNESRNLLMISCVQSSFMTRLRGSMSRADYDRTSQVQSDLLQLSEDQAVQLLTARMDALGPLAELRGEHGGEASLWPLSIEALRTADEAIEGWTPRMLLSRAARWFEETAGHASRPKTDLPEFLGTRFEALADECDLSLAAEIVTHGLPLLCALEALGFTNEEGALPRDVSLRLTRGHDHKVDVVMLNDDSVQALWRPLRRLRDREDPTKIAILRDARKPISPTAKKTHEFLGELEGRGSKVLWLRAEAIAAIDAARQLLGAARAGDLSADGDTIPGDTVIEWLASHLGDRLAPVKALFDELPGQDAATVLPDRPPAPPPEPVVTVDPMLVEEIKEIVDRERVIRADTIAARLERSTSEIEAAMRRRGGAVGLLDGPPLVLFALRQRPKTTASGQEASS